MILHPTASLPPAGSRARPAVPSSGAPVAPGPPGVFGPECQSTGLMRVSTDLLQSLSLGIFRAPFRGSNAAPRQPGWHKASSPAFVYTWHDSRETNPRRAGQEYQGHLPGLHRAESHLLLCPKCVDTACWNLLAVWFSSGDATNMDEIHRLTRVTARGLHLPRQAFNTDTDRGPKGKGRLKRVC